jgi:hypothetical protein
MIAAGETVVLRAFRGTGEGRLCAREPVACAVDALRENFSGGLWLDTIDGLFVFIWLLFLRQEF